MRFAALIPDAVTGRLTAYRDAVGKPVEFEADSQDEANRLARVNRLPWAVIVMPDELQNRRRNA